MDVMAGVSWDGSILVNLGKSLLSRRGLDVAVESATVDMAQVVVLDEDEDEVLTVLGESRRLATLRVLRMAALEKARMGLLRAAINVNASVVADIFMFRSLYLLITIFMFP
mmetsp:Transcript_10304/g.22369  ORF Transcript_10304/g.22369 Transcript_10304/m.22369 type:complete len:111 (+) Transcript_10304:2354-2686(+)